MLCYLHVTFSRELEASVVDRSVCGPRRSVHAVNIYKATLYNCQKALSRKDADTSMMYGSVRTLNNTTEQCPWCY